MKNISNENRIPWAEARRTMVKASFVFGIVMILIVIYALNQPSRPPATMMASAGQVQSIQLHETALSRTTTVMTSTGIYQVAGSVSAALGEIATLKKDSESIDTPSTYLCIASTIKNQCYKLL